MRKIGWFQVVMGCGIVAVWTLLLATGEVPEVREGRTDIWFHLAAELVTGAGLVVAGVLALQRTSRAPLATCVALGALGYTAVNSAGYYAQAGEWVPVAMFAVVATSTLLAATRTIGSWSAPSSGPVDTSDPGHPAVPVGHGRGRRTQRRRR